MWVNMKDLELQEGEEIIDTIRSLEDINGYTLDNTQVGFDSNGNVEPAI